MMPRRYGLDRGAGVYWPWIEPESYATERWQSYYRMLSSLGQTGVRLNGLVSLVIGGPIVILHNVWSGPPLASHALRVASCARERLVPGSAWRWSGGSVGGG